MEVPADGALGYLPSWNGDLVTYAATGWLADAGFGVGSRLVTMATAASASPALSFVACELVEELHCVEVAAPP